MEGLTRAEAALFKAYDIRGAAPRPLSPALAFRVGRAFAERRRGGRVGIGRDMRLTSPALAAAFAAGLRSGGASVTNFGLLPTDAMWFAVRAEGLDGGAMITASHNPPGDNGIKLVERDATPVFEENGLPAVRRSTSRIAPPAAALPNFLDDTGQRDISAEYRAFLHQAAPVGSLPPLRVVLDAGNGMGGRMAEKVLAGIPGDFIPMFFERDGSFPNHGGNPLDPANRRQLIRRVLAEKADFGVLWDGDADRCAFVDDRGMFVPGDFTTALLAPREIAHAPGAAIVFDLRSSRAVPEAVERAGGRPCPNRVGHAFMKQRMRKERAVFGGELSGHFYFRAAGYADNALLPILRVIERIGSTGRTLSELAEPLRRRYFNLDETSIRVSHAGKSVEAVRKAFPGGSVSRLDGLTVDFPDWRFTLRPSHTEPVLRLTVEGFRKGRAERGRERILEVLSGLRRGTADARGKV